jgi:UDP-glucose 4-epimerase
LRLFSTYGPGDNPRRLVPRVIAGALAGTPLRLSRPDIVRDWVYIDDVISLYMEAARKATQAAGGVFNAGSGAATDLGEIVRMILQLTASTAEAQRGVFPAPEHDAYPWVADTRNTFREFSWRPSTTLEAGLRATISSMAGCSTR